MNMTLDEYKARAKADLDNAFEKGKSQGGTDWLYYSTTLSSLFGGSVFPENTEMIIQAKDTSNVSYCFNNCRNIKSVKISTETQDKVIDASAFCAIADVAIASKETTLELIDFTGFKHKFSRMFNMFRSQNKLKSILGEMDLSQCTLTTSAFHNASALEKIRLKEGTISIALDFKSCTKLSAESYDSIMQGLSSTATGQTLTLPAYATVKATYDAKYGEGTWDILAASKTNWTIAYS